MVASKTKSNVGDTMHEHELRQFEPLIGCKLSSIHSSPDGFVLKFDNGRTITLQHQIRVCDAEIKATARMFYGYWGNGLGEDYRPNWIFINGKWFPPARQQHGFDEDDNG